MLPNLSYLCNYCLSFCFVLTIVLAVLRFKVNVSDYKYGIFKHFSSPFNEDAYELYKIYILKKWNHLLRFKNLKIGQGIGNVILNDTFSNISVISRRYILLVEETIVPGEKLPQFTVHIIT